MIWLQELEYSEIEAFKLSACNICDFWAVGLDSIVTNKLTIPELIEVKLSFKLYNDLILKLTSPKAFSISSNKTDIGEIFSLFKSFKVFSKYLIASTIISLIFSCFWFCPSISSISSSKLFKK